MNEFYVYALIDPRNEQIFYIGKGKGDRYLEHIKEIQELEKDHSERKKGLNLNKIERIKEIVNSANELKYKFIAEKLSEEAAYVLEEVLVERFGRELLKNGQLLNLEPGGKWNYPKLILTDEEKTSIEEINEKYPELIDILENYPHIATESKLRPWWINKIPKRFALFQYSLKGDFLAVHNETWINSATGMSWRLIDKCIVSNKGYAYKYQWSRERRDKMENLELMPENELFTLENFTQWKTSEIRDIEMSRYYEIRNQEIED
jgi:hypothetical protein